MPSLRTQSIYINDTKLGITGGQVYINDVLLPSSSGSGISQAQLDLLSGFLSTGLTNTGAALIARDASISGALAAQISSAAAGVSNLNGLSGAINLVSAGTNVFITTSGQNIFISGSGIAQSSNLAQTGSNLYNLVVGLSGQDILNYATIPNLTQTGVQLITSVNSLSGYLGNISGGLQSQIGTAATIATVNLISGNLIQTGIQLGNSVSSLSGYLGTVSGGLQAQINTAGQIKITGSNNISSANFTGAGNITVSISGVSVIFVSGDTSQLATITNLASTGNQTWNSANNNGINLSGNLATTGSALVARENSIGTSISGNLYQTGSNLYFITTGLSGYMVSLIGASAAGVSSINGASGVLTIGGASNISVTTVGQNITVSGNTGDYALFAQKTALTTTGQVLLTNDTLISGILTTGLTNTGVLLGASINSLSGYLINVSGGLQAQIGNFATNASLGSTGSNLYILITGLSGQSNLNFATISNLTQTGIQLGSSINSLSGYLGNVSGGLQSQINTSATITNLTATGATLSIRDNLLSGLLITGDTNTGAVLYNLITSLSGQANINYATVVNLASTGSQLNTSINSLSGYLGNISGGLQAEINTLATITTVNLISGNLIQTGVQLGSSIGSLSGYIAGISGGLQIQINSGDTNLANNLTATGATLFARDLSISGALQAQIVGGAGTSVSVSGSTLLSTADFSGIGGTLVILSGNKILISGGAGGGGGITQQQLDSLSGYVNTGDTSLYNIITGASGWLLSQPQVNLNGNTGLLVNTIYYDNFSTNRTLTITGSQFTDSNFVTLYLNVTGVTTTIGFPTGYRLGVGTVTGLTFTSGLNVINFTRSNGQWLINDSASYLNNITSLRNPSSIDSIVSGYGIGSTWINPSNGFIYECLDNTSGVAVWSLLNGDILISGTLSTGLINTGIQLGSSINSLSGYLNIVSGGLQAQIGGGGGTQVTVSGSTNLSTADFSGIGGTLVIRSGNKVLISGGAGGGGGITQGQLDILSGYTYTGLTNTGVILGASINSLSGYIGNIPSGQIIFAWGGGIQTGDNRFTFDPISDVLKIGPSPLVLPNNPLAVAGSGNAYYQINIQNRSSGISAQSDYVLTADIGNDTNYFVDLGINNTKFADTGYQLYKPLDGYLYVNGGDMHLGTSTPNNVVKFHVGGIQSGNLVSIINNSGIIVQTGYTFIVGNPVYFPNTPLSVGISGNFPAEISMQNRSSGISAQSQFTVLSDIATSVINYAEFGINSSKFGDTGYQLYKPLDAYLYSDGGDLFVGTANTGNVIGFHVGGQQSGNLRATIHTSGINIPAGTTYYINNVPISSLLSTITGAPGGTTGSVQFNVNNNSFSGAQNAIIDGSGNMLFRGPTQFQAQFVTGGIIPDVGNLSVYSKMRHNRPYLDICSPNGRDFPLQPHIGLNRIVMHIPETTTTIRTWGMPVTSVGTVSTPVLSGINFSTAMRRWNQTSTATANSAAESYAAQTLVTRGTGTIAGGFTFITRWCPRLIPATGTQPGRGFIGMWTGITALPTTQITSGITNCAGFGWDNQEQNLSFYSNGATGNVCKVPLGPNFPISGIISGQTPVYTMFVYSPPSGTYMGYRIVREDVIPNYSMDGTINGTSTQRLPDNNQFLTYHIYTNNNGSPFSYGWDCNGVYLESDY